MAVNAELIELKKELFGMLKQDIKLTVMKLMTVIRLTNEC
jgi:hypothetical protein